VTHANGPLELEGRQRLVKHCRSRPIAHMAAEAGICRACLSKWKNRYDTYGETGPQNRSSVPPSSPTPTSPEIVERIELLDEKATTAAAFLSRTRAFFTTHRSGHGPHHSTAQTIAQPGTQHLRSRAPPQPPAAQRPPTSYGSGEQFTSDLKTVGGWGPSPAGAGSRADP
jgi:hypothetical protein